jgi:outer membrane protein OmpA-like peptidoglycan-associated protein
MSRRPWLTFIALALILAATRALPAGADPVGSYFTLTPFAGYTIFDNNLHYLNGLRTSPTQDSAAAAFAGRALTDDLYVGARLGWQYNTWLGLEVAGGFTPTTEDTVGGGNVDFMHGSANIMLTPFQGRYGGPFLFAGGGAARIKPDGGEDFDQGVVEAGGGLRFWLTDAIGVRLEARSITWLPKDSNDDNLNYLVFGGGITLALGGTGRDTDGDGVTDRRDKCPDTPPGARVDGDGCPIDSDGDKVFDGLDQCEGTPAGCVVDGNGCPVDADGDGVCDGLDECAETPRGARVDAKGCPIDSDGDGVFDGIDQCEGTVAGASVDEKGCPNDSDGDGVVDGIDQCPNTSPGLKVDATGCPIEVVEKETELLDTGMIRIENINFETAKADILSESYPTLDVVATVLKKWPELRIEIGGHTDSRGSDAYNQRLSQQRAQAVYDYLIRTAPELKAEQFSVKGYGESRPVAPNTTDLNMAKNRRVEFVVLNKDVLRREIERRRLLREGEAAPPSPAPPSPAPPDPAPPDPGTIAPSDTTAAPSDTTATGGP